VLKTGDIHPVHNLLAFVEYGTDGVDVWTSIALDPEAPFRLAAESKQYRECGSRDETRTVGKLQDVHSLNQHPA
jgi:hypothetical protein